VQCLFVETQIIPRKGVLNPIFIYFCAVSKIICNLVYGVPSKNVTQSQENVS
jgi:hypothetical protein